VTGTPSNQRTGVDMPEGVGIGLALVLFVFILAVGCNK